MQTEIMVGFATLIVLATCSPGPNVLAVISNALIFGIRGAAFAILGNLTALFLVASAAAFGVSGLMRMFPDAFTVMKLAGAVYLVWIGWRAFRSSFVPSADSGAEGRSNADGSSIVIKTMLISLSNPKSVLFLSAVFPTFLDQSSSIVPQFAIMFAIIIGVVATVHATYAVVALGMRSKLVSQGGRRWTARLSGLSFAAIGIGLFAEAARR